MKLARERLFVGVGTAAAGGLALAAPERLCRLVCGGTSPAPPLWVVRLLGTRYLVQAIAEVSSPSPRVWLASSAIDSTHVVSMVAASVAWPAYRRAALVSGVFGTVSAGATLSIAKRA
ncbi:MAG TPA: hypothetical protein VHX15_20500 [Frankiaceae bacterium]|nr:hypothetical protein [Frankiaceae bacterium]